jgi:hypothetical protein
VTYIIGQEKPSLENLTHFGVKGMRWGVRKEEATSGRTSSSAKDVPPEERAKREEAAKHYEAKAEEFQRRLDTFQKNTPETRWNKRNRNDTIDGYNRAIVMAKTNAQNKREGKLTEQQKTAVKGAAIAVGILAAYGAYKLADSGQGRELITKGQEFLTRRDFAWAKNPELSRKGMSIEDLHHKVVDGVNPSYGGVGTKMNCKRCTFAYEMRRRGYDVAATRTNSGANQGMEGMFRSLANSTDVADISKSHATFAVSSSGVTEATAYRKIVQKGSVLGENMIRRGPNDGHIGESIFKTLAKQPNGARGELGVKWSQGGGHSVAWEIVGGKPVIFDCQTGKRYTDHFSLFQSGGIKGQSPGISDAAFTRLDNVHLNEDFLRRWLKNA